MLYEIEDKYIDLMKVSLIDKRNHSIIVDGVEKVVGKAVIESVLSTMKEINSKAQEDHRRANI